MSAGELWEGMGFEEIYYGDIFRSVLNTVDYGSDEHKGQRLILECPKQPNLERVFDVDMDSFVSA